MGNSKTSRYADGKTIYDLNHVTAKWLRGLAQQARFELTAPLAAGVAPRRSRPRRLDAVREAILRVPSPQWVGPRRGAGEVQRVLLDPDIGPRLRTLARRRGHDEGDVAAVWARVRVESRAPVAMQEADPA